MQFVSELKENFVEWRNKKRYGEVGNALSQKETDMFNGQITSVERLGQLNPDGKSYSNEGTTYSSVVNLITIEGIGLCIANQRTEKNLA